MRDRNFSHSSYYRLKSFSIQLLQEMWKKIHLICYIFQETVLLPSYPPEMRKLTGKQPQFWCLWRTTPHTALLWFTTAESLQNAGYPSTNHLEIHVATIPGTVLNSEKRWWYFPITVTTVLFLIRQMVASCCPSDKTMDRKAWFPCHYVTRPRPQWSSLSDSRPSVLPSITFAAWPGCSCTGEQLAG